MSKKNNNLKVVKQEEVVEDVEVKEVDETEVTKQAEEDEKSETKVVTVSPFKYVKIKAGEAGRNALSWIGRHKFGVGAFMGAATVVGTVAIADKIADNKTKQNQVVLDVTPEEVEVIEYNDYDDYVEPEVVEEVETIEE